jgi:hypothetical protein
MLGVDMIFCFLGVTEQTNMVIVYQ